MFNKVISVIVSFVMSFSGMFYTSINNVIDSASEMLFGVPYTVQAMKSDFFDDISDSDVVSIDENSGFIDNLVVVFIDGEMSFLEKVSLFSNCGGALVGWCAPADLYVLKYSPMTYNQVTEKCKSLEKSDGVVLSIPVSTYKTVLNATPNDTFDTDETLVWDECNPLGSNWWLEAIQARQAWDYSDNFSKIKIGVVDSGFDLDHPELEGKISFPSDRLANRNDSDIHGSHVAGIIGAKHNNGIGIAGVCDNSELICVDWYPNMLQFWNTELAIFFGFSYVVKAGAKVVNFSLGTSGSKTEPAETFLDNTFYPAALSLMMASLLSKGYDFVAVQSAGNGDYYNDPMNADTNGHFCAINENNAFTGLYGVSVSDILDRIIVVSSAEYDGISYVQAEYSNVGPTVDIAAPGDRIYSCDGDGDFTYLTGTSMSTPVVSGVASLVWSVNPSFSGADIKDIVCSSYDSIAKINIYTDYYHEVDLYDYPMVNAKLAVEEALLRTNGDWGSVNGRIIADTDCEIIYNGVSHTVLSDGSYSFVAAEGSGQATVVDSDGAELGKIDITVLEGQNTQIPDFVYSEEPGVDTDEEIEEDVIYDAASLRTEAIPIV